MEIKTFIDETTLPNVPPHLMAIDLELANSFQSSPGVICMIGVEHYDPQAAVGRGIIASTTDRSEEKELIQWLLDYLEDFHERYPQATLLTFSGLDNDIRWLNERLVRYDLGAPEHSILARMDHLDLKVAFYHRTQNIKISLKRLEGIFGIDRSSSVTSKKVSYILTDILRNNHQSSEIPDRLYEYLREDVHNLLVIKDRWETTPLDTHNLTEGEFDELLTSLSKGVKKLIASPRLRKGFNRELEGLGRFVAEFDVEVGRVRKQRNFSDFSLPRFPPVHIRHSDFERMLKKYNYLESLEVVDRKTGQYRFRKGDPAAIPTSGSQAVHADHAREPQKAVEKPRPRRQPVKAAKREKGQPQGALAVVRHEGRLLMIRRANSVARAAGFWGLPGGVVEPGETPTDCAVRELKEEVNLEGQPLRVMGTTTSYSGEYHLTWVEMAVTDITPLRPSPQEVAIARWVLPEEVGELKPLIPGAVEGLEDFLGD